MVNKNAVGVRIASLRKREGFSQAEFSALLNVKSLPLNMVLPIRL